MNVMSQSEALNAIGGAGFWEGFACGAAIGGAIFTPYTGVSIVVAIGACGPLVWDGN
jgi:hypothetical protein